MFQYSLLFKPSRNRSLEKMQKTIKKKNWSTKTTPANCYKLKLALAIKINLCGSHVLLFEYQLFLNGFIQLWLNAYQKPWERVGIFDLQLKRGAAPYKKGGLYHCGTNMIDFDTWKWFVTRFSNPSRSARKLIPRLRQRCFSLKALHASSRSWNLASCASHLKLAKSFWPKFSPKFSAAVSTEVTGSRKSCFNFFQSMSTSAFCFCKCRCAFASEKSTMLSARHVVVFHGLPPRCHCIFPGAHVQFSDLLCRFAQPGGCRPQRKRCRQNSGGNGNYLYLGQLLNTLWNMRKKWCLTK